MESLAGKLLVAIPELHDPNFFQSVVLLFQHDVEGASGVILNRPSDVTVGQVWEEVASVECVCDEFVHIGGPVEGPLIGLHTCPELSDSEVIPGLYVSMGKEHLDQLVVQGEHEFRIFSGYSGWGPGQLSSELEHGGWLTMDGQPNHVFESPDRLWKQVCAHIGADILRAQLGKFDPGDPTLN